MKSQQPHFFNKAFFVTLAGLSLLQERDSKVKQETSSFPIEIGQALTQTFSKNVAA